MKSNLKDFSGSTSQSHIMDIPVPSSSPENIEDSYEISYIMERMETLEKKSPETFAFVMYKNKELLDTVSSDILKGKDLQSKMDSIYSEISSIDKDYIFWVAHKCIRIAAIETHSIEALHFFLIKKNYKMNNKLLYKNFINDYVKSLKDYDFIDGDQAPVGKYLAMLQMMLKEGKCDVNDNNSDSIQNTPLHYTIVYRQLQFFIMIIKHKYTDLNKINANGDTPLDFAIENVLTDYDVVLNKEFANLLIGLGAKTNSMTEKYSQFSMIMKADENFVEEEEEEIICKDTKVSNISPENNDVIRYKSLIVKKDDTKTNTEKEIKDEDVKTVIKEDDKKEAKKECKACQMKTIGI